MDFYSILLDRNSGGSVNNFHLYMTRNLTNVTTKMLDGITKIKDYAFYDCTSLTSVTIPEGVTSIGKSVFSGCTSLTNVTIPEGVTSMEWNVFYNCTSLPSVTIPDSVTSMGNGAFYGCTSLTSIEIPSSVTSMGNYAFYGCTSLTSVTVLANTPPTLESYAFQNTHSSLKIYVPSGSVNAYKRATNWKSYSSKIQAIPS